MSKKENIKNSLGGKDGKDHVNDLSLKARKALIDELQLFKLADNDAAHEIIRKAVTDLAKYDSKPDGNWAVGNKK